MEWSEVREVTRHLKDFQRDTVEHVARRMYVDTPRARRFLVADEVGLGKTMVARGIIAHALHHLRDAVERVDVVYVCSNSTIAEQNIRRLNVLGKEGITLPTRLTMLPVQARRLEENRVNFVSFTPGTTFDLKSRGGRMQERALLVRLLGGMLPGRRRGLRSALQCTAGDEGWRCAVESSREPLDGRIEARFAERLRGDACLLARLEEVCDRFTSRARAGEHASRQRYALIGELRHLLAQVCVEALEPDLVILDEFQRFRDLLGGDGPAAELAQSLFSYQSERGDQVRVLLLSATPYRMLSLDHEGEDHHADFLETLRFLFDDEAEVAGVEAALREYRSALYGAGEERVGVAREAVERRLRRVMCRTERVGATVRRDAMLVEPAVPARLAAKDLSQAVVADGVARAVGARDPIEYWKSAPYLLSFMKDYEMRRKLRELHDAPPPSLVETLRARRRDLLREADLREYRPLDPANARLRALMAETVDAGQWQLLWIPPSLPYLEPGGAYRELAGTTKTLIFSSWNLVPDAVAALCSYESERRMLGEGPHPPYSSLTRKRRALLRFAVDAEGRPAGMPALALLYPCAALAAAVDPLRLAVEAGADGGPLPVEEARARARDAVEAQLRRSGRWPAGGEGTEDRGWYWAALALLDAEAAPGAEAWARSGAGWLGVEGHHDDEGDDSRSGFAQHVDRFADALRSPPALGTPPGDLLDVLAELALGSPAVCALRALARQAPELSLDHPALLTGAARVAEGFRSLFNVAETMALLRGDEDASYWRLVLHHCIDGNLQAVLDEHAHMLRESLGLFQESGETVVERLSVAIREGVSVRTAGLKVEEVRVARGGDRLVTRELRVRTRLAIRYGELRGEDDKAIRRAGSVQQAFNSPFRPFVLPSTSIGQEGLDFHPYCHAVYHWNLPANPVDFEQREGRVHRYKGHAIRKNVAHRFGLAGLRGRVGERDDPWSVLFARAVEEREPSQNDLVPFWIYEDGPARVERRVPMLPFSREQAQLRRLKERLAIYRLVFGQPRQEDLLAHLEGRAARGEVTVEEMSRWRICLAPPWRAEATASVRDRLSAHGLADGTAGPYAQPRNPADRSRGGSGRPDSPPGAVRDHSTQSS
jgi:hypothetical protein